MRLLPFFAVVLLLAGCAETYLIEAEEAVTKAKVVTPETSLKEFAVHSEQLSKAYMTAAQRASQGQDAAAVVTFLAAAVFTKGAVGSASDSALANAGLVGAGSAVVARRNLSQTTIQGIYASARRMNCISTTARLGQYLELGDLEEAAQVATYGAIEDVKITARAALVREEVDFAAVREEFLSAVVVPDGFRDAEAMGGRKGTTNANIIALNRYLTLLGSCVGAVDKVTPVTPLPKE